MRDMASLDLRPQLLLFPFHIFFEWDGILHICLATPNQLPSSCLLGFSTLTAIPRIRPSGQMLIRLEEATAKPGRPRNSPLHTYRGGH
jgi:hypothetical protein